MKPKPIVIENYADNGAFSHYSLVDSQGNVLWEQPDVEWGECVECDFGDMRPIGYPTPNGGQSFSCNICGKTETWP